MTPTTKAGFLFLCRGLLRELRLHQWAKNTLVFIPLLLSGLFRDSQVAASTVIMFVSFGLVASSTYVVNDLHDLADDRKHWSKRNRPLASGELPIPVALAAALAGLLAGFTLAYRVSPHALGLICAYVVATVSYSLGLKRVPILDVLVIAGLFTLRLGAGIVACGAVVSPWLLVFSTFLFSSLSFAKRCTEITGFTARGATSVPGRGYRAGDGPLLLALGASTASGAVLVVVLYILSDAFHQSFYQASIWLWSFPITVFLFLSRIWLVCHRGELDDDPVMFALRDRVCLLLGVMLCAGFVLAWLGVDPF